MRDYIFVVDIEKGQTLEGQLGRVSGYAVVGLRDQWYPVYWDGQEGWEMDLIPTSFQDAMGFVTSELKQNAHVYLRNLLMEWCYTQAQSG
jgi:hypothetical protein